MMDVAEYKRTARNMKAKECRLARQMKELEESRDNLLEAFCKVLDAQYQELMGKKVTVKFTYEDWGGRHKGEQIGYYRGFTYVKGSRIEPFPFLNRIRKDGREDKGCYSCIRIGWDTIDSIELIND